MKNIFFTLLFLSTFSFSFAKESEVTLKIDSGNLYGTLSLPKKKSGFPVVLFIAGSGPTDRNGNQASLKGNSLKFLADELNKLGIASLRYDKRGIGKSTSAAKKESETRFEHMVSDAKGWIDLLASDTRYSKIVVAGFSEGSLIGMIACNENNKASAYISVAGPGRPADDILKEQLGNLPDDTRNQVYDYLNMLKDGDTIPNVLPGYEMLFRPSVQPYLISWFKYDPAQEIKKLKIPVLIIGGTTDIQVPVKDADSLHAANPKAEKVIIENMNHVMKECKTKNQEEQMKTYSDPKMPLHKEVVLVIEKFILK
jgi:uncharacterized protein